MSTPINAHDAWILARIREDVQDADPDACSSDLARQLGQAMIQANGRGRPGALADFLTSLGDVPLAFAVDDAIRKADPSGPPPEPPPPPYQLYSLADALAIEDDEPDWLIANIVQRAGVSAIIGGPGSKKTFLAFDMALCAATGTNWLDFPTQPCKVLIVDEESGKRRVGRRLRQAANGHDADSDAPITYVTLEGFNLGDPVSVATLERLIAEVRPDLVILDSLAALSPGADENSVKEMQPIFNRLRRLAELYQLGFLIIHHANKQGGYRGSTAIKAGVDTMLAVESKADSPNLDMVTEKTRDGSPFCLSATFNIDADEDAIWFTRAGTQPKPVRLSNSEAYVNRYLLTHGPAYMSAIMDNADACSSQAARQAVYALVRKGSVRRCNEGQRGVEAQFEAVQP